MSVVRDRLERGDVTAVGELVAAHVREHLGGERLAGPRGGLAELDADLVDPLVAHPGQSVVVERRVLDRARRAGASRRPAPRPAPRSRSAASPSRSRRARSHRAARRPLRSHRRRVSTVPSDSARATSSATPSRPIGSELAPASMTSDVTANGRPGRWQVSTRPPAIVRRSNAGKAPRVAGCRRMGAS